MEPLSKILFSLYQGTPFHDEWMVGCLQGAWAGLLGDRIDKVCRPAAVRGRELVVEVFNADWLPILSGMKLKLLERIHSVTGDGVLQISFKLRNDA
jgi:hypothetical protein